MQTPPPRGRKSNRSLRNVDGVDPLHRLSATPTGATKNARWNVHKKHEKKTKKEINVWGVDPKALREANRLKSQLAPPSLALESYISHATYNQRQIIEDQHEKARRKVIKVWGVDESAIQKADQLIHNLGPPSEYLTQTTNATHHQQWLVHQELEKNKRKEIKIWGVDDPYSCSENVGYHHNDNNNNSNNRIAASVGAAPTTPRKSTITTCSMSLSSNRKRRPTTSRYSSSQSYTDYYLTGASGRKRNNSVTAKTKRQKHFSSQKDKYGETRQPCYGSLMNRDVIITHDNSHHDLTNASVLTYDDEHSEWLGGNDSVSQFDEPEEHNNNNVHIINTPPINNETSSAVNSTAPSSQKQAPKQAPLDMSHTAQPRRTSNVAVDKLTEKLVDAEKKVIKETKVLSKIQKLKRGLILEKRQSSRMKIIEEGKKNPRKMRVKRGESLKFWKKRKKNYGIQEEESSSEGKQLSEAPESSEGDKLSVALELSEE